MAVSPGEKEKFKKKKKSTVSILTPSNNAPGGKSGPESALGVTTGPSVAGDHVPN